MPMADLRNEMEELGFKNVQTLLNSGNVIFDGPSEQEEKLEEKIAAHLEKVFGFTIPVLIRSEEEILELIDADPFNDSVVTPDIRLYVTFLKKAPESELSLPWISDDGSYQIIDVRDRTICSVLDLSVTNTPKGMDALEKLFGKKHALTTRNWNTLNRIAKKLS